MKKRLVACLLAAAFLLIAPASALAQSAVPVGSEFQVNSYTTGSQSHPSVAAAAGGNFVVVWESNGSSGCIFCPPGTDIFGDSIQGQRYASDGSKRGSQFQVNTYTPNNQLNPSVGVALVGGDFVVVWHSPGDNSGTSIQGQRYASDGSKRGSEFQVNTYTTNDQSNPSVGVDSTGDFVVVWQSEGSSGTDNDGTSIQGQRYASDGSKRGSEFQVNSYTTSLQLFPSMAVGNNADRIGDFVVVWESFGSSGDDNDGRSIQFQRYTYDGTEFVGQFQVNSYTTGSQRHPSVAVDTVANFVVVWESFGSSGDDDYSIQGRYVFDNTLGGQFPVNSYTTGNQRSPAVAMNSIQGDFVVVWESSGSSGTDNDNRSIQGKFYASDGTTLRGQFQVNTYTTNHQEKPAVVFDVCKVVVVWESFGSPSTDNDDRSIQGQRYSTGCIFADGFESGNTSAWSTTVGAP